MTGGRYRGRVKGLLAALFPIALTWNAGAVGAQENQSAPQAERAAAASVPQGDPGRISDWALAGVLWSDAHLVRRIAAASASEASNDAQRQRMRQLQRQCDALIESLKEFGWQQRVRRAKPAAEPAAENRSSAPTTGNRPGANRQSVPNPDRVGEALERQLGDDSGEEVETKTAPAGTLDRRVNTETPAGVDDPGVDDEPQPNAEWFDLSQYRVDDFADEAPVERQNTADAVEDGVEGAIAAGIGSSTSEFDQGGRISERELQTRSRTLPVGEEESIYDTDDYDPNVDFEAENPAAVQPGQDDDEGALQEDFQDEPGLEDRLDSQDAVDNEDELARALTDDSADREREATPETIEQRRRAAEPVNVSEALASYTDQAGKHRADARWVQFHMATNQRRWDMITGQADPQSRWKHLRAAIVQLKSDAQTVRAITDSPELVRLLDVVSGP